uniref:dihydrofolate reductase n=1 Tax=Escherichia coli TaxID=562 RepID=UPI001BC83454
MMAGGDGASDERDATDEPGANAPEDADLDPDLVLVAAVAENGVIGDGDGMPWHYPADLAHFKRLTTGHPAIVGRTTHEGIVDRIGGPLPD